MEERPEDLTREENVSEETESSEAKSSFKKITSSKNFTKIVIGAVVGIAVIIALLFATHVICFHDYASATCDQPRTCKICGKKDGTLLKPCEWVDATCTEPQTCVNCGKTRGNALGHNVSDWTTSVEATCTEDGEQVGICSRCENKVSEAIPAYVDHKVVEWTEDKAATCIESGHKQGDCSLCSEHIEVTIPTLGHVEGESVTEREVSEAGIFIWKYTYCARCGGKINAEIVGMEASGHNYKGDIGDYIDVSGKVVNKSGTSFWIEDAEGVQFKCTPPNSGVLEYIMVGKTMDVSGKVVSTSVQSVNLENVTFSDYGH